MRHRLVVAAATVIVLSLVNASFAEAFLLGPDDVPATHDSTRHGLFNALDSRSVYGTYWFPEPLNSDEGDVDNEVSFKFFHAEKQNHQADEMRLEVEHAIGLLTV